MLRVNESSFAEGDASNDVEIIITYGGNELGRSLEVDQPHWADPPTDSTRLRSRLVSPAPCWPLSPVPPWPFPASSSKRDT